MKTEQRVPKRSLCADLVTIELTDERGWRRIVPAVLEDISERGVCLQVESAVPVYVEVKVLHGGDWSARGLTTYCVFREIGYFVGIEFEENTNWSAGEFRPEHLFSPEDLT